MKLPPAPICPVGLTYNAETGLCEDEDAFETSTPTCPDGWTLGRYQSRLCLGGLTRNMAMRGVSRQTALVSVNSAVYNHRKKRRLGFGGGIIRISFCFWRRVASERSWAFSAVAVSSWAFRSVFCDSRSATIFVGVSLSVI